MDNEIDWEEIFTAMGLEWKEKLSVIKAHGIHTLQLTDEQKAEIDTVFSALFERSSVANEMCIRDSFRRALNKASLYGV